MTNKTNKQTLTAFIYSRTFRLFALRICTFVVKKYNLFSFFSAKLQRVRTLLGTHKMEKYDFA